MEADKDKDGKVNFEEFTHMVEALVSDDYVVIDVKNVSMTIAEI